MNHELPTAEVDLEDLKFQSENAQTRGRKLNKELSKLRANFAPLESEFGNLDARCNRTLSEIRIIEQQDSESSFLDTDGDQRKQHCDELNQEFERLCERRKDAARDRDLLRMEIVKTASELERVVSAERNLSAAIARLEGKRRF